MFNYGGGSSFPSYGGGFGGFGNMPDIGSYLSNELARQQRMESDDDQMRQRANQNIRLYGTPNPISQAQIDMAQQPQGAFGFGQSAGALNLSKQFLGPTGAGKGFQLGGDYGYGGSGGGSGSSGSGGGISSGLLGSMLQYGLQNQQLQHQWANEQANRAAQLEMQRRGFANDSYGREQNSYLQYGI